MVEENLAAQTTASAVSGGSQVGAGATQRGRCMVVADLYLDDHFDRRDQQLPRPGATGSAAAPDSRWTCAGRTRSASFAIGSRLALSTDAATYWRAIRVGSDHLSSDPPRVHFGFPRDQRARSLRV